MVAEKASDIIREPGAPLAREAQSAEAVTA